MGQVRRQSSDRSLTHGVFQLGGAARRLGNANFMF